ncbi:nicotinate-nucleotide--dimethylbenzimidazole phosphoribosyltransferase [Streptacidiphilus cavernicola]|uniref:Nicotinate-nucleotide--dimethylbenzimidazole phosphoribosyltransferase n=1 Tax=Streptacidiphilus cavernicola TaxID=3342716 RepID=A0ABV6VQE8_9ACTN
MSDTGHVPTGGLTEPPLATTVEPTPPGATPPGGEQPVRDPFGADPSQGHGQVYAPAFETPGYQASGYESPAYGTSTYQTGAFEAPGYEQGGYPAETPAPGPARPAYTFLDLPDEEDEDELLMPGPTGSWSEPVQREAAQSAAPVLPEQQRAEDSAAVGSGPAGFASAEFGSDSGSAPAEPVGEPVPPSWPTLTPPAAPAPAEPAAGAAAQQPAAAQPVAAEQSAAAPRRPLHAGPPIPDPSLMTGQVPVRSLADRGPSGRGDSPFTVPAPPTPPYGVPSTPTGQHPGPEYLDQPDDRGSALRTAVETAQAAEPGPPAALVAPTVPPQMPSPESTLGANAAEPATPAVTETAAPAEAAPAQAVAEAVALPETETVAPEAGSTAEPEPVVEQAVGALPAALPLEQAAEVPVEQAAEPVAEATPVAPQQPEPAIPAQGSGAHSGGTSRISAFMAAPMSRHLILPEEPAAAPADPVATAPASAAPESPGFEPDHTSLGTGELALDPQATAHPTETPDVLDTTSPETAAVDAPDAPESALVTAATAPTTQDATVQAPAEPTTAQDATDPDAATQAPGPVADADPSPLAAEADAVAVAAQAPAQAPAPQAEDRPPVEPEAEPAEFPVPQPVMEPLVQPSTQSAAIELAAPAPAEPSAPVEPSAAADHPDVAENPAAADPPAPGYDDDMRDAVHRVMRERRDIRNGFRPDPIPHEVLIRVLEAAHTAPSVGYSQPWDFVVIRSAKTRARMHELAERQREAYAASLPKGRAKQFKELKIEAIVETPVNIVVTADRTRGGRHTLGRHTQPQMAPYSAALAVENLWLAARAEGLGIGWVSFFDEQEMVRELGLPEHLDVVAYLCVGYVNEFPVEPELAQAGWAKKRPLSWVVHEETYGRRALPGEEPHSVLQETLRGIRPLDAKALGEAWDRQKRMTKPAGSLGMLEIISAQLCGLSRKCPPPIPEPACVAVFAGDHGVHAQGVTHWPQEVTAQMVANFLSGGAVVNAFAAQVGAEVCVVDVGVASELPPAVESGRTTGLLPRKVRPGTADMTVEPAMTREEALRAVEVGIETARDLVAAGNKALITGDMGIANTTAAAALICVFTGEDPSVVTGRGTGIDDETHARKVSVVRTALDLHRPDPADPIGVLAAVGGLEHAALAGFLLGAASLRTPVILDGVIAGSAALVAKAIAPEVLAACVAGHRSAEPGHKAALAKLGLRPLIDLDLRLGEGTGALLALPLVQSAARAMHDVATFDSAGVTEKH